MLYLPSMELEQRGMEQKQSRVGRGGSRLFLLGKGFLVRLHHFVAGQSIPRISVSMHVQLCRILLQSQIQWTSPCTYLRFYSVLNVDHQALIIGMPQKYLPRNGKKKKSFG